MINLNMHVMLFILKHGLFLNFMLFFCGEVFFLNQTGFIQILICIILYHYCL